jgi:hypothetical protein
MSKYLNANIFILKRDMLYQGKVEREVIFNLLHLFVPYPFYFLNFKK